MLVLVILVVTCAEISITLAYFQLTNEVRFLLNMLDARN